MDVPGRNALCNLMMGRANPSLPHEHELLAQVLHPPVEHSRCYPEKPFTPWRRPTAMSWTVFPQHKKSPWISFHFLCPSSARVLACKSLYQTRKRSAVVVLLCSAFNIEVHIPCSRRHLQSENLLYKGLSVDDMSRGSGFNTLRQYVQFAHHVGSAPCILSDSIGSSCTRRDFVFPHH